MSEAEQREIVAFLSHAEAFGQSDDTVEVIRTHASVVFLCGERAYKLKRAVKYSYLDYSTPTRRRAACAAELAVNRRTAPSIYLAVRAVTRAVDGGLALDGAGKPVDWLVEMHRFPDDALLDRMAESGRLTAPIMTALTDAIVSFHRDAAPAPGFGGSSAVAALIDDNLANLAAHPELGLTAAAIDRLRGDMRDALERGGASIDRRQASGCVRQCHGDLHLGNICLLNGRPTLFDAIEFSPAIANIDVLYDLAFLLMDLLHRRLGEFAAAAFNRYLDWAGAADGLPAMPLYLALRAVIRGHVRAAAGRSEEGCGYVALATELLRSAPPVVVAIGGPSGSGKSVLAAGLAVGLGVAPGARVLRSDVIRKRLHGVAPTARLPPDAYAEAATARVFDRLCAEASDALAAGYAVICDAVAMRPEQRAAFAAVAAAAGVPFQGLWLEAPPAVLAARVGGRQGDASDATAEVVRAQLARDPGPMDWLRIDASGSPAASLAAARRRLAPIRPRAVDAAER